MKKKKMLKTKKLKKKENKKKKTGTKNSGKNSESLLNLESLKTLIIEENQLNFLDGTPLII